jgi:hypothetical protein
MAGAVVVVEFNELVPELMDRFIKRGLLPAFARMRSEAQVYVTTVDERPPYLEPWIQWITVHTGLTYAEHKIFDLGDGHKVADKAIWDVVSEAGDTVWICGSMNVQARSPVNGAMLPDPWTTQFSYTPAALGPYFRFVQRNVTEYTNEKLKLSPVDYASFVAFMARHGLSFETASAIVKQLASERLGPHRWRRALLLDRLQLDLFCSMYRKLRPALSTYFTNSTAHFQHLYWRNMEPHVFPAREGVAEPADLASAIEYGYVGMDRQLDRILRLAGDDATVVFCTALSQQPCLTYESQGGKSWYRPLDFDRLFRWAGFSGALRVAPVMSQYFHAYCSSSGDAQSAAEALRGLRLAGNLGTPVFNADQTGDTLMCGCGISRPLEGDPQLVAADGRTIRFFDLMYRVDGTKSGMHHPDGMLWIRKPDRRHAVHPDKVPLTSVAPTILRMLGHEPPATMRGVPLDGLGLVATRSVEPLRAAM